MIVWFPYYNSKRGRFVRINFCLTHLQLGIRYTPQEPHGYEIAMLLPLLTIAWCDYSAVWNEPETTENGNL